MYSLIKKVFFNNAAVKTFYITRLLESEIAEKVVLKNGKQDIDISRTHGMICLDPFCIGIWLSEDKVSSIDPKKVEIEFTKGDKLNATIELSLIEKIATPHGELLLYKIEKVKNHQLTGLHRLLLLRYLLRSKNNTYYHRRVVSALYSYPRSIIIVSYRDDKYYNVFPMDIHAYLKEEGMYILGLRTTNITLDKILEAKKVVICDTDHVDIKTVYDLGKHSSTAPTPIEEMPFRVIESELFHFYVPEFVGAYTEIEIIHHRKMGYHMLLVGKIVNNKVIDQNASSLYHVGFLEYQKSNYPSIEGTF